MPKKHWVLRRRRRAILQKHFSFLRLSLSGCIIAREHFFLPPSSTLLLLSIFDLGKIDLQLKWRNHCASNEKTFCPNLTIVPFDYFEEKMLRGVRKAGNRDPSSSSPSGSLMNVWPLFLMVSRVFYCFSVLRLFAALLITLSPFLNACSFRGSSVLSTRDQRKQLKANQPVNTLGYFQRIYKHTCICKKPFFNLFKEFESSLESKG